MVDIMSCLKMQIMSENQGGLRSVRYTIVWFVSLSQMLSMMVYL